MRQGVLFLSVILVLGFIFFYLFATFLFVNSFPKKDLPNLTTKHTQLAKDIFEYKKIIEIDDGTRSVKRLNNVFLKMTKREKHGKYYLEVLDSLSIPEKVFSNFQERLETTKLRQYRYYKGYGVFTVDGFLNDEWGYVYDYQVDSLTNNVPIFVGEHIKDNWYYLK